MSRFYKYKGKKYPSVTTITSMLNKPALVQWAANCACDYIIDELEKKNLKAYLGEEEILLGTRQLFNRDELYSIIESARKNYRKVSAKALDVGSAVHHAIEQYLQTGEEPQAPSDQVLAGFVAFLEWEKLQLMEALETEQTIYNEELEYAGTADLICNLDFKKYIIDFKTAKGIYPEYRYQIAAYRQCDPTIQGCGILRLDKETGYPEWVDTSETYEQDAAIFNALRITWRLINGG